MLDQILEFKGEAKKITKLIVKYNFYLIAHNGSGFDSYVVLNNFPQWRTVATLTKNACGFVSLKIINEYVDEHRKNSSICTF